MSSEILKARQLIAGINSFLKQGKLIPATQSLYDAVVIVLKTQLMKSEKDEFSRLIDHSVYILGSDTNLKKIYPLLITYKPGAEKELLQQLSELLKELQASKNEEIQDVLADMQRRKSEGLAAIQNALQAGDAAKAKKIADKLFKEFANDTQLKADIADLFVKAQLYTEALAYLEEALKHDPKAIHLYNRIGIVLRRMRDFETAEKYYLRALEVSDTDEYLWFNIGRLYHDTQRWEKMEVAAQKALAINPEFAEAGKMLAFARKKIKE